MCLFYFNLTSYSLVSYQSAVGINLVLCEIFVALHGSAFHSMICFIIYAQIAFVMGIFFTKVTYFCKLLFLYLKVFFERNPFFLHLNSSACRQLINLQNLVFQLCFLMVWLCDGHVHLIYSCFTWCMVVFNFSVKNVN